MENEEPNSGELHAENNTGSVKDNAAKIYFQKVERVADLINRILYAGANVVTARGLKYKSGDMLSTVFQETGALATDNRYMDMLIKGNFFVDGSGVYMLMNLEFQARNDPMMVFRMMEYAARGYRYQIENRTEKEGKILPIIPVVLNLSDVPWKEAVELFDFFNDYSQRQLENISNFRIAMIDPYALDLNLIESCRSDLRFVLKCFKFANDKEKLQQCLLAENEVIKKENIEDVQALLLAHLGMQIKLEPTENQEEVKVCQAFKEILFDSHEEGRLQGVAEGRLQGVAEGRAEGVAEGRAEGEAVGEARERENGIRKMIKACRGMGVSDNDIITVLGSSYSLTPKEAQAYLE